MEQINSTTSRKLSSTESMQKLEKLCYAADARLKIRMDHHARARLWLGVAWTAPLGAYLLYHTYAPGGVMQNHRSSQGLYMYNMQNFLGISRPFQQVYRPELWHKERALSLHAYSRKIEALKKEGSDEVVAGVHHPTAWH